MEEVLRTDIEPSVEMPRTMKRVTVGRGVLVKRPERGKNAHSNFTLSPERKAMANPSDRMYSASHEWHKFDGDTLTLGLTKFAVDQLTDVTYVEMKKPGFKFAAGGTIGEVESVKTTSDIYSAVAGEIIEVNSKVVSDPSILNTDSFGEGWLVKIKVSDKAGMSSLMDSKAYDAQHP